MLQLNQLLDRFKNLTNTEKFKKQQVAELFIKNNIPLTINQLNFSNNTIHIKTSPIIKTEILLKKEEFLKEIRKIPGLTTTTNIY